MATNEIGEKVYFSDATIKVTNARVSCNHITVPVEKVESVVVNSRIEALALGFGTLLLCSSPFLFLNCLPDGFKMPVAIVSLFLIAASSAWVYMIYKNYIELVVSVAGRNVVIFNMNMSGRDYLCKIASAIGDAITDEKRYQKMKASGELPTPERVSSSDTMRFKMMLEDYEKLKKAKEESSTAKSPDAK
jgi:hypothetical protein